LVFVTFFRGSLLEESLSDDELVECLLLFLLESNVFVCFLLVFFNFSSVFAETFLLEAALSDTITF